jgi:hypothetical protein
MSERRPLGHARCGHPGCCGGRVRARGSFVGGRRLPDGRAKRRYAVADRGVGLDPTIANVDSNAGADA